MLQSYSGVALKTSRKGKSSQWAEPQAVYLIISFVYKEKSLRRNTRGLIGRDAKLSSWSQSWKEKDEKC